MLEKFKDLFRRYPWVVLFAVFILGYACMDMTRTDREHSEIENRSLNTRPKITWDLLMRGELDDEYDKYINDQFVGRDMWISLKSFAESVLLKTENNGIVYGKDSYMFGKYDALTLPQQERYQMNVKFIREFFDMYPETPITFSIVPNAYAVLRDKLPYGLALIDQESGAAPFVEDLPGNVTVYDPTAVLAAHKEEYIYYHTDHHWTTYGAYLAAQGYAESKGLAMPALDTLAGHDVPGFYGTNFSKAKKIGAMSDVLTYYDIPFTSFTVAAVEKDSLYDLEKLGALNKYPVFLWGNNNFTTIRTQNNINHRNGKTTRVLLIKDSYGNSFAPFLSYLYDEVDVVDLRYTHQMKEYLANPAYYDDVLLMYNYESLVSESSIANLRY